MASVNRTRPHCVNQMGKTHSKPLAAGHGRGTAWARHALCESALNVTSTGNSALLGYYASSSGNSYRRFGPSHRSRNVGIAVVDVCTLSYATVKRVIIAFIGWRTLIECRIL